MRVVILAGGKGRRIAPFSLVFPKPLMPIGDKPILEILVRQLRHFGFREITFAVGYLASLIETYFGDGSRFGVAIDYSHEDEPLGTAGPLSKLSGLDETFLVMNGDLLTTLDYRKLVAFHRQHRGLATIATYPKAVPIDLGVIERNDDSTVRAYIEKPTLHYQVSMGVYVFEPEILSRIPRDAYFDFPDLVQTLLQERKTVVSYPFDGFWLDLGRHDDYEQAMAEFNERKDEFVFE